MTSPIGTPSYYQESIIKNAPLWEGKKEPEAKIVKSNYFREMPDKVTFHKLVEYHDLTPQIQIAVSSYAELITGTELVVDADNEEAKEFIDEWIRSTNFYDKFEGLVHTLLICGNAILEKLDEADITDVSEVDMTTIVSKQRNDVGELLFYEQRQKEGQIAKLGEGNIERFIEFNLTNYSKQAWGRSLFYSLAIPRYTAGRWTAPLIEIMWGIEDAMGAMLLNNAYPITTITYQGANDDYLEKETEKWRRYKPGDKRVQKIKPEIEFFETQTGSKYTDYVTHLEKAFELGTQFPHDIMTGDFTSRASSETTDTIVMKRTRGFQRYLCNKLKGDLFDIILDQNGFKSEEANLSLSFSTQNVIELEPNMVLDIRKTNNMTLKEYRNWLRTNTGMELPDDAEILADEQQRKQAELQPKMDPKITDKVKELESVIDNLTIEKSTDQKIREMQESLEHKLNLVKEAVATEKETLAKKRLKTLETIIERLESIG